MTKIKTDSNGKARVSGNAWVYENARVFNDAMVNNYFSGEKKIVE